MKIFPFSLVCVLGGLWLGLVTSCSVKDEYDPRPIENYNALWEILDRHYSFFDLKLSSGSSWRDMYYKHYGKLSPKMTQDSLFTVMTELMSELKDGHVNLITPFDYGRYWKWQTDHPSNYSSVLSALYLGEKYRIAGGLRYAMIEYNGHEMDSIGYIRFGSFASSLSESNLNAALSRLLACKALIIDIRDNGGGNVSISDRFAQHFMQEARMVGYTRHKTGPRHSDFSPWMSIRLSPIERGVKWLRPVVVLVNRGVYSAANDFTMKMKGLPWVTIMGDQTGGGGGLPMSSELPNGWAIRFSSTQTIDNDGHQVELGIEPDVRVGLDSEQAKQRIDSMIEGAISYIKQRYAGLRPVSL